MGKNPVISWLFIIVVQLSEWTKKEVNWRSAVDDLQQNNKMISDSLEVSEYHH